MTDPVLAARENRWEKKLALARRLAARHDGEPASLAVLTLRMPAFLRTSGRYTELARRLFAFLADEVAGRGFPLIYEEFSTGDDGPEGYLAAAITESEFKSIAVGVETGHPWGELADLDVMDAKGRPFGRQELGLPPRPCLVCGEEAIICSAGKRHDEAILAARIGEIAGRRASSFDDSASRIGRLALTATLYEAAAAPKPGLVDPHSRGAHRDMDYFTFLASAAALGPWFSEFARLGGRHRGELAGLLPLLREAGKAAERDMLAATGGVNTHKGLIFSMGLLCAGAGRLAASGAAPSPQARAEPGLAASLAAEIVSGITLRDLGGDGAMRTDAAGEGGTVGEKLYAREGVRGIRGEAENGFPSVIDHALPRLRASLASGLSINDAMIDTLLVLFTVVEDTNVLGRAGRDGLAFLREEAGRAIAAGSMATTAGRAAVFAMDEALIARNISPGGCADLLALTVFLELFHLSGGRP